jgi:DNA-binding transcriptional LysR family regulator
VGELRIAASSFMAPEYLVPALDDFIRNHPQLRISIDVCDHNVDLMDKSVDLALRVGRAPGPEISRWPGWRPYCARRRLISRPTRRSADPRTCSITSCSSSARTGRCTGELTLRNRAGQCAQLRLTPRITASHARSLRQLAVQGHGLGRFLRSKVQDDLKSGRLVEVLPDWSLEGYCAFITTRHRDPVPPRSWPASPDPGLFRAPASAAA